MTDFYCYLCSLKALLWSAPLILFLVATGLYLTIRLRGVQFTYLLYGLRLSLNGKGEGKGDISHFQALMTALAAALGIGNIAGVATAVAIGGFGSIFWLWVVSILGMGLKYAEATLAIKYRSTDERGEMAGGPMFYIYRGLGKSWRPLAYCFAIFGSLSALTTGNMVQANSVGDAVSATFGLDPWYAGLGLMFFVGLMLIGGIKSIGRAAAIFVPVMALLYLMVGLGIITMNSAFLPSTFRQIFEGAFAGQAAAGGFAGATVLMAIQMGTLRGVFCSEGGLGTSSIAAAAARSDYPGRQAMIVMAGTFVGSVLISTITALVLGVTGVLGESDAAGNVLNGAAMTVEAFRVIPGGKLMVTTGVILFAYTTILGWGYYGEKCTEFLFGYRSIVPYRILFVLVLLPGATMELDVVWALADIANGMMAIPNLIALIALSGTLVAEHQRFQAVIRAEKES